MSTLHGIREFALIAVLATGALVASATQADESRARCETVAETFADLGHMTVLARRPAQVAHLGSMTVTARRLSDARFADLGAITVTARRIETVAVAEQRARRFRR